MIWRFWELDYSSALSPPCSASSPPPHPRLVRYANLLRSEDAAVPSSANPGATFIRASAIVWLVSIYNNLPTIVNREVAVASTSVILPSYRLQSDHPISPLRFWPSFSVKFRPVRGGNPPACGDCHASLQSALGHGGDGDGGYPVAGQRGPDRAAQRYSPYGNNPMMQQQQMMMQQQMMAGMMSGRGGRGGRGAMAGRGGRGAGARGGGRSNVWTPDGAGAAAGALEEAVSSAIPIVAPGGRGAGGRGVGGRGGRGGRGTPTKGPTSKVWVRPGLEDATMVRRCRLKPAETRVENTLVLYIWDASFGPLSPHCDKW